MNNKVENITSVLSLGWPWQGYLNSADKNGMSAS